MAKAHNNLFSKSASVQHIREINWIDKCFHLDEQADVPSVIFLMTNY